MKAILEFNLPEDNADHLAAVAAPKMASIIWEWGQYLRDIDRYGRKYDIDSLRGEWVEMTSDLDIDSLYK